MRRARGKFLFRPSDRVLADDHPSRLSRKDSLKRHIKIKHKKFQHLLDDDSDPFGLLVPRSKNSAREDLTLLKQIIFPK